ncbi:plasmid pRiA4b ORF-3 family protein [Rhodococcus jostii]|nr:plasmid pRiA4b ORF-3 family protein [Rhodococcus jostii]
MARSTRAHARRSQPVTYQVRVDLDDAKPPIWRRLLLSSELMLDELHAVLQQAMGWTDSHLHQFLFGENKMDRFAEQFHMKFMLDEGADGVLENQVRLDELLAEPTDRLFYRYDFGDGWDHTLVVEQVLSRTGDEPPALCIGGARACPPEDCGGIWGYLDLLQDPTSAPGGAVPDGFDPTYFSVEETNACLRDLAALPVPNPEGGDRHFQPAATAVGWLLNRVGAQGIRLTAAGYLPPAVVTAAMDELRWRDQWIGTCTREDTTAPVFDLRETAAQLRLLRRYRGQLLLTKKGAALRDDPESLRRYLAASLPTPPWWASGRYAPDTGPAAPS